MDNIELTGDQVICNQRVFLMEKDRQISALEAERDQLQHQNDVLNEENGVVHRKNEQLAAQVKGDAVYMKARVEQDARINADLAAKLEMANGVIKLADAAMNHMGDKMNDMDIVEAEDEAATEKAFSAVQNWLAQLDAPNAPQVRTGGVMYIARCQICKRQVEIRDVKDINGNEVLDFHYFDPKTRDKECPGSRRRIGYGKADYTVEQVDAKRGLEGK